MDQAVGVVVVVLLLAGWWQLHARLRPWKTCRSCGGAGRIRSAIVPGTHSDCKRCGTKGRVRRWGAPGEER